MKSGYDRYMPSKAKEQREEQEKEATKEMLRRVVEFNDALKKPAKRIGGDRPPQQIKAVDGGKKPAFTKIEVDDDYVVSTDCNQGPGTYDFGVKVNISVEDDESLPEPNEELS